MSQPIVIRFKLQGEHANLARELQRHLRDNEGLHMDLDEIVRRQFINWMNSHIIEDALVPRTREEPANGHTETMEGETVSLPDSTEKRAASAGDALLPVTEARQD